MLFQLLFLILLSSKAQRKNVWDTSDNNYGLFGMKKSSMGIAETKAAKEVPEKKKADNEEKDEKQVSLDDFL